ncbi:2-Methylisocitrate lyase, PEP mutase family [Singulisphaera sp. GP187]|uniref:isocitrate lyase/PEP mutase family protein n=1 Tax=Singulisphaera sp. GP187 TaxID=1882752 RepID=UPI000925DE5D|nr:isocitrate lyase/phosphoenolpyruvate mutase family protein [Singulisphaera sp. GP187]SIO35543.1 2-Methylisocitrate lyase, PEP mutase family [Singulisphaera sp. GP187]
MKQPELHERFRALHEQEGGVVMPNAWDGVSALLLKQAGFQALGSSSAAIAFALGRPDGAHAVSKSEALENAALLGRLTGLPVNADLEDGFGPAPEDCAATVEAAIAAGMAGVGIEDTTAHPEKPIHDFDHAVERIRQAARVAKGRIMLTGRTDNYLFGRPDLDDTIRRLVAFADVGADVLYAPLLPDIDAIRAVVKAVAPKPVNVLIGPGTGPVPIAELQAAGVRRVSLGSALYCHAMASLQGAATALAGGNIAPAAEGLSYRTIMSLLSDATAKTASS